jgi:hypothetical protein
MYLFMYFFIYFFTFLLHLFIIYSFIHLFIHSFIHSYVLFIYLFTHLFTPVCLKITETAEKYDPRVKAKKEAERAEKNRLKDEEKRKKQEIVCLL